MTQLSAQSIDELTEQATQELNNINDLESLDQWRITYLGRRGSLTSVLRGLSELDLEQRRELGALGNQAKNLLGKADAQAVEQRHQRNVVKTQGALATLKDLEGQLSMVIDMVEYQFVGVDEGVAGKVSVEAMDKEMRSNAAVKAQVDPNPNPKTLKP